MASESTSQVRDRVAQARNAAAQRWQPHGFRTNAEVSGPLLRREFRLGNSAMVPLRTALDRGCSASAVSIELCESGGVWRTWPAGRHPAWTRCRPR
ncbi:magnesium chelatase, subunit ChlI family protein [Mycobacterium ulcerans str. Harvey]|uniref:Magnesium chelatase, subunit ChlI family protein n=1 Tax=Mycobacterium ulcerans str. Harvey TaxID=1299332 RepID=A0ABN0R0A9_MYCUL|nr:magnesium chelatase, subunit ChlI family protein [Mycobacterium ulcerans str. Harvey]